MQASEEERKDKLAAFLLGEMVRREHRQCVQFDLLYRAGPDFDDEVIRTWSRKEDPKLFEDLSGVIPLALVIFQIAKDEAALKAPGRYRFILRTRQHLGMRLSHSFTLTSTPKAGRVDDVILQKAGL